MRSAYILGLLMMSVALPAYAAGGLNKHDNSIANYGYNIQIQTGATAASGGSLRDDIDRGVVQQNAAIAPNAGNPQALPTPVQMAQPPIAPAMAAPSNLAVGADAPNFQLARPDGQVVALKDILTNGPALVFFTQGSATVSGTQQMQILQKNMPQFKQLGINVVAISADPLDSIQRANQRYGITYDVLSDTSHYAAQQYGLQSGNTVVPALYSIDQQGKIAAVQTWKDANTVFDLNIATAPLRNQQAAVTPPQAVAPSALPAPAPIPEAKADNAVKAAPAPIAAEQAIQPPAGQQRLAPSRPQPPMDEMMAVPSGQAGKVNYAVPPSHPDFKKLTAKGMAI